MGSNSAIEWTGRQLGVLKTAAKRLGLSLQEYQSYQAIGLKWCYACAEWHERGAFATDATRSDGLAAICQVARSRKPRKRNNQPIEQRRAHRLVQMRVRRGKLPHPDAIPCMDCGHIGADRRHEYDHYLGYAPEHHATVQPVCSRCHHEREKVRRGE